METVIGIAMPLINRSIIKAVMIVLQFLSFYSVAWILIPNPIKIVTI